MLDYKYVVDQLPHAIYLLDINSNDVLYINEKITKLSGYAAQDYLESPHLWLESVHPDDKSDILSAYTSVVQSNTYESEYRIICKDGSTKWVRDWNRIYRDENNQSELIFGMVLDISEHQGQLSRARQNLDELIEESITVVYRCEPSGNFPATFISNNIVRQLGYKPEQFLEDPSFWASHIHPDDQAHVFADLGKLFEKGMHSHEYRFLNGHNEYVWMHDELRLVKDDKGQVKDIVGNWIDVTKTKKLEFEKAEQELVIQQAKKMQAIGTLAGGIAHEFNNMLGIILGFGEILEQSDDLQHADKNYVNHILVAANRSKKLVQQILAFGRKNEKNPELVNLCDIVFDEIEFIRSSIPASVKIKYQANCASQMVFVDPDEIRQILINLSSNAVFAMQNKGVMTFEIDKVVIDSSKTPVTLNLNDGDYIKISVSDTGSGIREELQQKIFEPFFTTKDVGEGTGLGLALVYSMMDFYHGTVNVVSKVGEFTTFELYFPVVEDVNIYKGEQEESTVSETMFQPNIIFVDDEELFVELAKTMFGKLGYHVTTFTNGPDALNHYKLNPEKYNLLITDQTMPDMLGTELSREILNINKDMHIILCSGNRMDVDRQITDDVIFKGFLPKPFSRDELKKEIQSIFNN